MRGFGFLCLFMVVIATAAFMYHGNSSLSTNPDHRCYVENAVDLTRCDKSIESYACIPLNFLSNIWFPPLIVNYDMFPIGTNAMKSVQKSRNLKDNMGPPIPYQDESHLNLEDYRPIDPVPSSKASIRPGPVQHGTPLMPYIPKPSPTPGKPQHGG